MKIFDLTHMISQDMPVYPGTEKPLFTVANTHENDGFTEKRMEMYSHTGTHIDAPFHILSHGKPLNEYTIDKFIGRGIILHVDEIIGHDINISHIEHEEERIRKCDFVILKTGWSKYWGKKKYFNNYPCLTEESAAWLSQFDLKGIGVDTISVDPIETKDFSNHRIFMKKDMIIVENLCYLDDIANEQFLLVVVPLKIENSDGSPIRAIAITNEEDFF
ncbi:MAG: cyclase family protein [Eubacteriales bacterium]